MNATIQATHHVFAFDCPDAAALAQFYARLLGWQVLADSNDDTWVEVTPPKGASSGFHLAFQQVQHYRMPEWPDGDVAQQAHLDFSVDSLEDSCAAAAAAGATRHSVQPAESDGGEWVVFQDPAGHLFCLCQS